MADLSAFAEVQRAIVVAAHADDLETMIGGTMMMLVARGVAITSVNCTLGDIGAREPGPTRAELAALREAEACAAGQMLGLAETITLSYHDGELEPTLALRAILSALYRRTQADTLFTFDPNWIGQVHPDHRAAGRAAIDAYMPSKMPLYHPEQLGNSVKVASLVRIFVFSPALPSLFVDIGEVYERKVAACLAHRSQFPADDRLDWMREQDRRNGERIGAAYAEAFAQLQVW